MYNEAQYFKALLGTGGEKKKKDAPLRPPKQPVVYPPPQSSTRFVFCWNIS
jgi:hypothetical protein